MTDKLALPAVEGPPDAAQEPRWKPGEREFRNLMESVRIENERLQVIAEELGLPKPKDHAGYEGPHTAFSIIAALKAARVLPVEPAQELEALKIAVRRYHIAVLEPEPLGCVVDNRAEKNAVIVAAEAYVASLRAVPQEPTKESK